MGKRRGNLKTHQQWFLRKVLRWTKENYVYLEPSERAVIQLVLDKRCYTPNEKKVLTRVGGKIRMFQTASEKEGSEPKHDFQYETFNTSDKHTDMAFFKRFTDAKNFIESMKSLEPSRTYKIRVINK